MRFLVALLLSAGCRPHTDWVQYEPCSGRVVRARVKSIDRHWFARRAYRALGRMGMPAPVDELVLEVCNGGDEPIQIARDWQRLRDDGNELTLEQRGTKYQGWTKCHWAEGASIELEPHQAVTLNHALPSSDELRPMSVEIPWEQHTKMYRDRAVACGTVRAR